MVGFRKSIEGNNYFMDLKGDGSNEWHIRPFEVSNSTTTTSETSIRKPSAMEINAG